MCIACRRRRFKSGCEVNFARMLCGGLKSNGLADPFKNNEDDTFPEEQLPPPLQEHDPSDQVPRRPRPAVAPSHPQLAPAFNPYMQLPYPLGQMYPVPAMVPTSSQHAGSNTNNAFEPSIVATAGAPDVPMPRPLSRTGAAEGIPKTEDPSALQSPGGASALATEAGTATVSCIDADPSIAASTSGQPGQQAGPLQYPVSAAQQASGSGMGLSGPPFMMPTSLSAPVGTTGIMHRPLPYPTPASLPSLFHPAAQPDATTMQAFTGMHGGNFPIGSQPMPEGFPGLYYGAARLYAQHMSGPFARAPGADTGMYGSAVFNPFLHMPFGATGFPGPQANALAAGSSQAVGSESAQAAESAKKRKSGASGKRQSASKSGILSH